MLDAYFCFLGDLDVDEILDRGNRLTTVDSDEWLKHLGYPDGKGQTLSIVLKFPDGLRKRIDVEDTTTLKVRKLLFFKVLDFPIMCSVPTLRNFLGITGLFISGSTI